MVLVSPFRWDGVRAGSVARRSLYNWWCFWVSGPGCPLLCETVSVCTIWCGSTYNVRRTCIVIRGSVVCSPPKHDRCIGTRISGQSSLFFFLLLLLFSPLLLPFVFSFSVFGLMFMCRDGESARWIMFGIRGLFRWRLCKWGILGSGRVLFSVLLAKATLIGFMALYHVNFSFD